MSPPKISIPDCLLTIKNVAAFLQVSEKTVLRRIAAGDLPSVREGRLLRVRPIDLDRYIAARRS